MILLRRVIGDVLRARRQAQRRTLREVSTAANVSLGYLSEIERGQKEASSELLSAICEALGAAQSEVLRSASDMLAFAEQMDNMLVPIPDGGADPAHLPEVPNPGMPAVDPMVPVDAMASVEVTGVTDGDVSAAVCRGTSLRTSLRASHTSKTRQVVRAA